MPAKTKKLALKRKVAPRVKKLSAKKVLAQARVAIAKDVLAAIRSRRVDPQHCGYITNYSSMLDGRIRRSTEKMPVPSRGCAVCAIGAMFTCAIDRHDRLQVGQYRAWSISGTQHAMYNYLKRWFSRAQLARIEAAYEGYGCGFDFWKAHGGYGNPRRVMRAIMNNIVENDGVFAP